MDFSSFKNKRVVVTGANGFIGSHIAKRMAKEGAEIFIIVREDSDLWRIEQEKKDVSIYKGDIRNKDFVEASINSIKPEYVFNIAAYGVDSRQKDYSTAVYTNVVGIVNMLEAVIKTGCKKFINTGTSMQYGNKEGIISEELRLTPSNIYGSSKAAATIIAHQIAAENNIDIATLIPFGVFGEMEGSHKFFPHIILSVLKNKDVDLTLCEQYRDYCYIENIIDGLLLAALKDDIKNEIFNIGSGTVQQLNYYVDMIFKNIKTDRKPNYGAVPYRKNDLWCPQPDVNKIKKILGWEPEISLEDGVNRTVQWFKANHHKYDLKGR